MTWITIDGLDLNPKGPTFTLPELPEVKPLHVPALARASWLWQCHARVIQGGKCDD